MKSYISKKDLTIYDTCPDYIPVDTEIADIVKKLYELGYEVISSSAGEHKPKIVLHDKCPKNMLEYYKNNPHAYLVEERENDFDGWYEEFTSHIELNFRGKFDFKDLPLGFRTEYWPKSNCQSVWGIVSFYDENDKRKDSSIVERELKECHKALMAWVETLPKIK